ncbi:MAG: ABC transporter substrate-binding protein [Verrucomicrobiales bacterium]
MEDAKESEPRGEGPLPAPAETTPLVFAKAQKTEPAKPPDPSPREPLWTRWRKKFVERFPHAHEKLGAFLLSLPLPQTRQERTLYGVIGAGLLLTLTVPFLLRPSGRPLFFGRPDFELVVLSPHNETIRREFGDAFAGWFKKRTGKSVRIDWRTPGGTSEIVKVIHGDYRAAFESHWRKTQRAGWDEAYGRTFADSKYDIDPKAATAPTREQEARQLFLSSSIGIGVDLFFGGGVYDFEQQRKAGTLVATDASGKFGLAALKREHPDWFSESVIPQQVAGEPYYDPGMVWAGNCLSTFGIVYNRVATARLGAQAPQEWEDLGDFRYFGHIAVADPSKSGSVVKVFEMIIQQQMRLALEKAQPIIAAAPRRQQPEREADALRQGWADGLRLIQRIGANARYFTDGATKVPQDVAQGIAAAGMCIDFYGRTFNERLRKEDGSSRVEFVTPLHGTSHGVDSIAMFRGAPQPEVAHAFLEFLFSTEGQALWDYKPGTPGGPKRMSLRRLPVRKDMYVPEKLVHFADPDELPYEHTNDFVYQPAWTAGSFDAIRVAVRAMCIDTHDELCEAWATLARRGFPAEAMRHFGDMGMLGSEEGRQRIVAIMRSGDKLAQVKQIRFLGNQFRRQYQHAIREASRADSL